MKKTNQDFYTAGPLDFNLNLASMPCRPIEIYRTFRRFALVTMLNYSIYNTPIAAMDLEWSVG